MGDSAPHVSVTSHWAVLGLVPGGRRPAGRSLVFLLCAPRLARRGWGRPGCCLRPSRPHGERPGLAWHSGGRRLGTLTPGGSFSQKDQVPAHGQASGPTSAAPQPCPFPRAPLSASPGTGPAEKHRRRKPAPAFPPWKPEQELGAQVLNPQV